MTDTDHREKAHHGSGDRDGHDGGGGGSPGKTTRAAEGGEHAAPAGGEPLADFRAALEAKDAAAALAAWDKLSKAQKKGAAGAKNTLLAALQVIGPPATRILKEAGSKPSADPRFSQEILHNGDTGEWIKELQSEGLLRDFLKAEPRRHHLDKPALERLGDFAGKGAPSDALALAAYEKAWGEAKSGKFDRGGWTIQGAHWDRDHLGRMYQALLTGGIPPAHLHGLRGVYIAKEYKENASGKKYELGFGYFVDSTIVMPLYKGPGGTGHDMVGGDESKGDSMGHFQSTALHEVGHLVGDETGEHYWGEKASSPLHMEAATATEVQKELWDNGKSEEAKGEDVSAADAKLYLEAEVRGEASSAFGNTAWHKAGKSPGQFRKKLTEQYAEQPLYKMAKAVAGNTGDAYREPARGTHSKGKMFAFLTRYNGGWAKYNKEAFDNKVSWYSMSSAAEWFAEQYQYYMTTDGEATLADVKTKFKKIMKELDERAPGKKAPAIKGPRGADHGGGGAAEAKDKESGGHGGGDGGEGGGRTAQQQAARRQENSQIHRFQIDW